MIGIGIAIVGAILFALGVFTWHSATWGTIGGLVFVIGIVAIGKLKQ